METPPDPRKDGCWGWMPAFMVHASGPSGVRCSPHPHSPPYRAAPLLLYLAPGLIKYICSKGANDTTSTYLHHVRCSCPCCCDGERYPLPSSSTDNISDPPYIRDRIGKLANSYSMVQDRPRICGLRWSRV